jgi:sugar phosphate isomerase/epimerase
VPKQQFVVSTRLYRDRRLDPDHLREIAASGFDAIELVALRTHVDFHNPAVVADLQSWLAGAGVTLRSVHVPVGEDAEQALFVARRIPLATLVVETTTPREAAPLVERLAGLAAPLGVAVAVDSACWSPAGSLVHFVEEGIDVPAGICLDFGHAQLGGELADTIEIVSEHLVASHVHDCRGRQDAHLAPLDGAIDWSAAMTELQKIGYDGAIVFDVDAHGSTRDALARLRRARTHFEKLLCMSI